MPTLPARRKINNTFLILRYVKGFKLARVFGFFLLCSVFACNKPDITDLGNDLIPAVDNVNTFLAVLDVKTDNKLLADTTRMLVGEAHAIGVINNDPEFGKTVATSYLSFTPTASRSYPFVKRDTVIIDSVVLSLSYGSTFGDSNAIEKFEVREISRFANFTDSLYPVTGPDFLVNTELLGSSSVQFNRLNDSVVYRNGRDTIRKTSELRIPLDTAWARRFVNYDTSNAYNNDTAFKEQYFRGLQIMAVDGQGTDNAIAYFTPSDNEKTRITFYCRVQNNGRTDTIAPYFQNTRDPQANIIRRTPANNFLAALNNTDSNDAVLYLQSAPGSYIEIEVPGIDTLADTNRLIHRAELVLNKFPSTDLSYAVPPLIFIDAITDDGDSAIFIRNDMVFTQSNPGYDFSLLGGIYRNDQYVFNLTRYIQSIVTKQLKSYKLRVYAPLYARDYFLFDNTDQSGGTRNVFVNTPVGFGRAVLYGGASADPKRPQMRIIYSRL
jgi:hypothetical protein